MLFRSPVVLPTRIEDDFKLRPEALRAALTPATRALLLCSPSNPTGVVYTPAELGALADVAIEADLAVVADEIYDQLVYDGRQAVAGHVAIQEGAMQTRCVARSARRFYVPSAIGNILTRLGSQCP